MTSSAAVLLALALIIHELTLLYNVNLLAGEHSTSKLVFLLSICLILEKIHVFPIYKVTFNPIRYILEIVISVIVLESSILYVWQPLENYVLLNADDILVQLYEDETFAWIVCPLCCGNKDVAVFARLVLKAFSFSILLAVGFVTKLNI
ncbi:unnamed protein product [Colias eurytheme]|nr:unnamed protein product [Colias eurytheme]